MTTLNLFNLSLGCLFAVIFVLCEVSSVSLEEDLTLTYTQGLILQKFKKSVESQLPHDYMKEDIYLIRWLRARDFDIDRARQMLFDNLEWRRANRMDTVHEEDWSDFIDRYKFWHEGVDKQGRPIAFLNLGAWDLRRAVINGEQAKLLRYIDRDIDLVNNKVRKWQHEGRNISQTNFIVNLAGYSVTQQGCLQCIPFYVSFVSTYETRYPGIADKIILVNTPSVFEVVLAAVRPIFSQRTRDALKILGTNKQQYGPVLFKDIEKDQLPLDVGGTDDGIIYKEFDDSDNFGFL